MSRPTPRTVPARDHQDTAATARWWQQRGCEYEAALALAGTGDPAALRRALDMLHGLGARPAAAVAARAPACAGRTGRPPRPTANEAAERGLLAELVSKSEPPLDLAGIRARYGPGDPVTRAMDRSAPELTAAFARVASQLTTFATERRPPRPLAPARLAVRMA